MHISQETPQQTDARLRGVIAAADLVWHPGAYAFYEFPKRALPADALDGSLAAVCDEEVWSVLRPAVAPAAETFALFSFHFRDGEDNSGFVGWLASELKRRLGTGVLVVCGQNSRRGGIFDYWGVPESMRAQVMAEVEQLRGESPSRG
ncbi:DUF6196 family protein [Pseudomonas sp. CGJS7]|uniref:DUF6196 family protein n=1 Tax=Pseudomonas sp. CGJS7 TaxID=3109348 RepID=UPI00300897C2